MPPARRRGGPGDGSGDDSGGGGGGGDGGGHSDERPEERAAAQRSLFALGLALIGVSTLFSVLVATWVYLRVHSAAWPPDDVPETGAALWTSSALLLASSLALAVGQHALRTDARRRLSGAALVSTLFGAGFLAAQLQLWARLADAGFVPASNGYGTIFYGLTAAHALHVLVGLGLLLRVALRALRPCRPLALRTTTRVAAIYWHFLGILWLVLFALLAAVP